MIEQDKVQATIDKAITAILDQQNSDGSWSGYNYAGPMFTAMLLITEHYLELLSGHEASEGVRWLKSQELDDGSYPAYPFATKGDLVTTALVYACYRAVGMDEDQDDLRKIKAFIDQQGGLEKVDPLSKVYLVLAEVLPPKILSRALFFPQLLPNINRFLGRRFGIMLTTVFNQLPVLTYGLQHKGKRPSCLQAIKRLAYQRICCYLTHHQNPDGNWAGVLMPSLWSVLCYRFLGIKTSDQRWKKAVCSLNQWKVFDRNGMHVVPYLSNVWNTALMVRILLQAGLSTHHEAVKNGLNYLRNQQSQLPLPKDWQNHQGNMPRTGGWAYESGNPLCSDCDTTAAVLWTLGLAQQLQADYDIQQASRKGLAWLMGMQNPCGGWASFTHGLKDKPAGAMFNHPPDFSRPLAMILNPPLELGDPATAGLTGRVLSALYYYDIPKETLAKVKKFLRYQMDSFGAWWGRWEVNYLAGSSYVLMGLMSMGENPKESYIQTALTWIHSKQNHDGGWGETTESYQNVKLAGCGMSQPKTTGLVLSALLDCKDENQTSVDNGINYLMAQQNTQGLWDETQATYVMIPPDTFYTNFIFAQYAPLEALLKYMANHRL